MKIGILFDVHGTLLDSNKAWISSFSKYGDKPSEYYSDKIWGKYSRKQLAKEIGVSFDIIKAEYRKNLLPRNEIVNMLIELSKSYEVAILSNARKEDVNEDLKKIEKIPKMRIFSREDGKKPDSKYVEHVLEKLEWEKAYMIGNDPDEDVFNTEKVTSLIVPYYRENI